MHQQGNRNVASKRPRTEGDSASSASLVPLEDMTNPKEQLDICEVILISSQDNSLRVRTSTNILLIHSKQLLSAAMNVEGPLTLDCCKGAMSVLDLLCWAQEWKKIVRRLTHEELLNLFEVAQMWQIDAVTHAMPDFISRHRWRTEQGQSALADLYARPNLGVRVYQAAIFELLNAAGAEPTKLLRLVPSPQEGHLLCPSASLTHRAVECLNGAQLPLISFGVASTLLRHLDTMAAILAEPHPGSAGQLALLNALHSKAVEDAPKMRCEPLTYFPALGAIGMTCSSLDRCIKDMLHHYLCEAIKIRDGMPDKGPPIQYPSHGVLRLFA